MNDTERLTRAVIESSCNNNMTKPRKGFQFDLNEESLEDDHNPGSNLFANSEPSTLHNLWIDMEPYTTTPSTRTCRSWSLPSIVPNNMEQANTAKTHEYNNFFNSSRAVTKPKDPSIVAEHLFLMKYDNGNIPLAFTHSTSWPCTEKPTERTKSNRGPDDQMFGMFDAHSALRKTRSEERDREPLSFNYKSCGCSNSQRNGVFDVDISGNGQYDTSSLVVADLFRGSNPNVSFNIGSGSCKQEAYVSTTNCELCSVQGNSAKACQHPNCTDFAQKKKRFCRIHGGWRKCRRFQCDKFAQGNTKFCIGHGGGRRCSRILCQKFARGSTGLCVAHKKEEVIRQSQISQVIQFM
mmetsp:Transcript_16482/g.22779  ORF Transcript_16482/g.22779 Transcript_16482/m.22779 type:complete len:351 (+) Transcript_16482:98-1150(+)